ncbi:GntR family transcriptional regulator [Propionibacteriaceae bacterium Y2011]
MSSAVDQIHHDLRDRIARGELSAGSRLRESHLAETYGCSTTPVREALRRLDTDGLVRVHPRRSAQVVTLDLMDVQHLYEIKLALECSAIRAAAAMRATDAELASLRSLIAQQESLVATDPKGSGLLSPAIHGGFARLAGNRLLAEIVERATRLIECVKSQHAAEVPGGGDQTHTDHTGLVDLVLSGDPDRAESAMRHHLEWARDAVLGALLGADDDHEGGPA